MLQCFIAVDKTNTGHSLSYILLCYCSNMFLILIFNDGCLGSPVFSPLLCGAVHGPAPMACNDREINVSLIETSKQTRLFAPE